VPYSSKPLNPETLTLLEGVFERCIRKIERQYGEDSTQMTARRPVVATRLISLAQQGVKDPDLLETQALAGLLPGHSC
jgi:hypothetical protein